MYLINNMYNYGKLIKELIMQKIELGEELHNKINETKSKGTGGFQRLFEKLDSKTSANHILTIDDSTYSVIDRYAYKYGSGGNQKILREILKKR